MRYDTFKVLGAVMVVIVWFYNFFTYLQLHVQSVPITSKVIGLNPTHGEVYSKQHSERQFVSDLRQVSGFLRYYCFLQQ